MKNEKAKISAEESTVCTDFVMEHRKVYKNRIIILTLKQNCRKNQKKNIAAELIASLLHSKF